MLKILFADKICGLCGDVTKFGVTRLESQTDDEFKEKSIFRIRRFSTINLLVSSSDMPHRRCFSIGGMKNQHEAIFDSFRTIE